MKFHRQTAKSKRTLLKRNNNNRTQEHCMKFKRQTAKSKRTLLKGIIIIIEHKSIA